MSNAQDERIYKLLEELKEMNTLANYPKMSEVNDLKAVDMYNSCITGAIAKLNVIAQMLESAAGLPDDSTAELIQQEAAQIELVMREQINGLCDCLLAVIICAKEEVKNDIY